MVVCLRKLLNYKLKGNSIQFYLPTRWLSMSQSTAWYMRHIDAQIVTNLQQTCSKCCSNNLSTGCVRTRLVPSLLTSCYKVVELNRLVTCCSNNLLRYRPAIQQFVNKFVICERQLGIATRTTLSCTCCCMTNLLQVRKMQLHAGPWQESNLRPCDSGAAL